MSKIIKIGICNSSADEILEVTTIKVQSGKGIVGDRHYKENNESENELTIIESENIDFYNNSSNTNFKYLDFRRNLVSKGLSLNKLINKKFFIGSIKVLACDFCKPCLHLQKILKRNDIVKKFIDSGGLRCKILSNGSISIGDLIKND